MTVERGQQSQTVDPQASLRTELVGQLASAQLALEAAIADLVRSGADSATLATSRSQLSSVISLRQQIGASSSSALAHLRAEVASAATAALATAQQASGTTGNADHAGGSMTPQAARQTIENIGHDIFDRKVLDPYLTFTSKEDEEAYRKREEENRIAYEREKAKNTTEGDRNAAALLERQLLDAGAHGASASPDYDRMLTDIRAARSALEVQSPTKAAKLKGTQGTEKPSEDKSDSIDDVLTTLKAAGVTTLAEHKENVAHGLTSHARTADSKGITSLG